MEEKSGAKLQEWSVKRNRLTNRLSNVTGFSSYFYFCCDKTLHAHEIKLVFCCIFHPDFNKVEALPTTLSSLALNGFSTLKRIAGFRGLGKIRRLDISNCEMLEELPSLEDVVSLDELRVS
eukprot:Gb_06233 [translate_table: standard]